MEYNNNIKQQVKLLLEVLGYINWNSCFAIKGGTAINFFYENMPRLSVDIDLAYLKINSRKNAIHDMKNELASYKNKINKFSTQ
ncbi:MAG: nucleotidyl transferase AbiEii/AbiGii toxin family protein [Spirochaetes bacterium]|nr:nucleotidyl transferase AbiEii/AbiGii toxin family protein [Spirochaetota bacterium]